MHLVVLLLWLISEENPTNSLSILCLSSDLDLWHKLQQCGAEGVKAQYLP